MTILLRFLAAASTAAGLTAAPLGWRDIGPYGNGFIRTPNIDRLARSGLRVEYAFGTTPQCSPSRISTLTGINSGSRGTEVPKIVAPVRPPDHDRRPNG